MRKFNELIFDNTIRGTAEVFSSPRFNDVLGQADNVVFETEVQDASGSSPTITLKHYHCCSNEDGAFKLKNTVISADSLASLPYRDVKASNGDFAGYQRIGITLGGTNPIARVRIWATGRVE